MLARSGSGGSCGGGGAQAALRGRTRLPPPSCSQAPRDPGPLLSWVKLHHPGPAGTGGWRPRAVAKGGGPHGAHGLTSCVFRKGAAPSQENVEFHMDCFPDWASRNLLLAVFWF